MGILVLGVSHHEAPIDIREHLAFFERSAPWRSRGARRLRSKGVILSTCNRTEVYAVVGHRRSGREQLGRFLSEATGLRHADFAALAYDFWQEEAARHLFRVAAGLRSMVLGEPQILGQVRDALELSLQTESAGARLSRPSSSTLSPWARRRARAPRSVAGRPLCPLRR